jgi:hypothetical protein
MFAAIKTHVQWFRYLGVHDLESTPLQPSPVAWARRFCDDWQDAANRREIAGASPVSGVSNVIPARLHLPEAPAGPSARTESSLPTFTLRHPGRSHTQMLGMTGVIEWREFHAARVYPSAGNIDRLLCAVDRDLAELEFGCSPLQSLSEIVLALEWLVDFTTTPEEARIWANSSQILFHLSVSHDYDTQIDLAWADKFRAEDANEPWARDQDSFDLPEPSEHVATLKRVAAELRSVLQGSYSDALDVAGDVGDALEVIWRGVVDVHDAAEEATQEASEAELHEERRPIPRHREGIDFGMPVPVSTPALARVLNG